MQWLKLIGRWLRREMSGTFDGTEEEFWDRQW